MVRISTRVCRAPRGDPRRRLDAVDARHPDVHQHDVRAQGRRPTATPLVTVAGLAEHLDVRLGLEDHPEAVRSSAWSSTSTTPIMTRPTGIAAAR